MQEELAVSVRIIYPFPIAKTSIWNMKDHADHVLLLTYLVSIGKQQPKIGDPETAEWKWFAPKDMHAIQFMKLTKDFVDEAEALIRRHHLLNNKAG